MHGYVGSKVWEGYGHEGFVKSDKKLLLNLWKGKFYEGTLKNEITEIMLYCSLKYTGQTDGQNDKQNLRRYVPVDT